MVYAHPGAAALCLLPPHFVGLPGLYETRSLLLKSRPEVLQTSVSMFIAGLTLWPQPAAGRWKVVGWPGLLALTVFRSLGDWGCGRTTCRMVGSILSAWSSLQGSHQVTSFAEPAVVGAGARAQEPVSPRSWPEPDSHRAAPHSLHRNERHNLCGQI